MANGDAVGQHQGRGTLANGHAHDPEHRRGTSSDSQDGPLPPSSSFAQVRSSALACNSLSGYCWILRACALGDLYGTPTQSTNEGRPLTPRTAPWPPAGASPRCAAQSWHMPAWLPRLTGGAGMELASSSCPGAFWGSQPYSLPAGRARIAVQQSAHSQPPGLASSALAAQALDQGLVACLSGKA